MAPRKKPPDKCKVYKCHPKQKISFVICLICESVYHPNDFEELKKPKIWLGDTFVICPDHENINLTSKNQQVTEVLSDSTKQIIAEIKKNEQERYKTTFVHDVSVMLENQSAIHDDTIDELDAINLKAENILLKKLVAELEDKNKILKQSLSLTEQVNKINTYSNVVKGNSKQTDTHVPSLVVQTKNENLKDELYDTVVTQLQRDILIPINSVFTKRNGTIEIKCKNKDDVENSKRLLEEKLGTDYEVATQNLLNPRIKVTGINNKMTLEDLENDINKRNFNDFDKKCKAIHQYSNYRKNGQNLILEVPPEIYTFIKNTDNKIYVGHQRCRIFDDLNISQCTKCSRFGHNGNKCTNAEACIICSGPHVSTRCTNLTQPRCVNCIFLNTQHNKQLDVNHSANDTEKCEFLKGRLRNIIAKTDYPVKPSLPRFVGKVGKSFKNKNNTNMLMRGNNSAEVGHTNKHQ